MLVAPERAAAAPQSRDGGKTRDVHVRFALAMAAVGIIGGLILAGVAAALWVFLVRAAATSRQPLPRQRESAGTLSSGPSDDFRGVPRSQ
jgi:hypothetical protein